MMIRPANGETCDWCLTPIDGDALAWHCTIGHPRCIVRAAVGVWVSRQIPGEHKSQTERSAIPVLEAETLTGFKQSVIAPSGDCCETPIDGDAFLDAFEAIAPEHRRDAIAIATWIWASRTIEGEMPPPIQSRHAGFSRSQRVSVCGWCFEPLGEMRSDFNGGTGHPECTRFAYECVAGDDSMPWPIPEPPSVYRHDPLIPFCRRLGREAAALGLDTQKLAQAIGRARCA